MTQGRSDDEIRADLMGQYGVHTHRRAVERLLRDVAPLLARAAAAERGEDDQRAMLRDCRAEVAAAQADVRRVGVASGWRDTLSCCRNAYDHALHVLAAASGVAPDQPPPTCICDGGSYMTATRPDWQPFIVNPQCAWHGSAPDQPNGADDAHS